MKNTLITHKAYSTQRMPGITLCPLEIYITFIWHLALEEKKNTFSRCHEYSITEKLLNTVSSSRSSFQVCEEIEIYERTRRSMTSNETRFGAKVEWTFAFQNFLFVRRVFFSFCFFSSAVQFWFQNESQMTIFFRWPHLTLAIETLEAQLKTVLMKKCQFCMRFVVSESSLSRWASIQVTNKINLYIHKSDYSREKQMISSH